MRRTTKWTPRARLSCSQGLALLALGVSIASDELAIGFSVGLLDLPLAWAIVLIGSEALVAGHWTYGWAPGSASVCASERSASPVLALFALASSFSPSGSCSPCDAECLNVLACIHMSHGVGGHVRPARIDGELARVVAERMQVLAAPSRVQILGHLKDGPCAVGEIASAVGMEPSAVSHQLRQLRYLGLVVGKRQGRHVIYALHDSHVAELLDQAVFHVQHLRLDARLPVGPGVEAS